MIKVYKLTLEDAKFIMKEAEEKAKEIGVDMDIAIVDDGGHLLMFERMDGAKLTSISIAIDKAFTAAGAKKATHEYADIAKPNGSAFGINTSNQGRFIIFGGGVPIIIEGQVVGAVGCSSGTAEEDRIVAEYAISKFIESLR